MEFFKTIYDALNTHPTAALLVLALIAIGYMWRDRLRSEDARAALYEKHAETIRAEHTAHLQTAMQVAPLAQKLVTCVEILERLQSRASA